MRREQPVRRPNPRKTASYAAVAAMALTLSALAWSSVTQGDEPVDDANGVSENETSGIQCVARTVHGHVLQAGAGRHQSPGDAARPKDERRAEPIAEGVALVRAVSAMDRANMRPEQGPK